MPEVSIKIEKLKEVRKSRRVWQHEVADVLGVSDSTYSLIERGERRITLEMGKKLANYFEMSMEELFFNQ